MATQAVLDFAPEDLGLCARSPSDGRCRCVEFCVSKVAAKSSPQMKVFELALGFYSIRFDCPAAKHVLVRMLRLIAESINDRIEEWTTDDPGKVDNAMLAGNTSKKRRLVDNDLKHFVCFKAMRSGKAYSSGNWATSTGVASESTAGAWDESLLAEYQAAGYLMGQKVCVVHIAPDAARFGAPAQETLLIPCWLPHPNVGCWLPPQERLLIPPAYPHSSRDGGVFASGGTSRDWPGRDRQKVSWVVCFSAPAI